MGGSHEPARTVAFAGVRDGVRGSVHSACMGRVVKLLAAWVALILGSWALVLACLLAMYRLITGAMP